MEEDTLVFSLSPHLRDDEGEDETPKDLGEEHATSLVEGLVDEEHLVLVGQLARKEVGDAHHQDERVHDRIRQANLPEAVVIKTSQNVKTLKDVSDDFDFDCAGVQGRCWAGHKKLE